MILDEIAELMTEYIRKFVTRPCYLIVSNESLQELKDYLKKLRNSHSDDASSVFGLTVLINSQKKGKFIDVAKGLS